MMSDAQKKQNKVLIAAGGTGGHVFPGLAIAKELRKRGIAVEWVGTHKGLESRLVPDENIPLHFCEISGVRGKGFAALLAAPFRIYKAINEAKKVLNVVQPQLVLGLGGFVAGPTGVAARMQKIPLVIHEQNAIAGTTNKVLAKLAQLRLCAFKGALGKSEYVGNPVREEIENTSDPEQRINSEEGKLRLLILGGSRGARALNELLPAAINKSSHKKEFVVYHQCGEGWQQELEQQYADFDIQARIAPFINDVATALSWADLVVCRAGALTVAELSVVGVASVLVPFPFAIDDHQTANAYFLERGGAAIVKQQHELSPEILAVLFNRFFADRSQLLIMAKAARLLAKTGVAKRIADMCEDLMQKTQTARRENVA